MSERVDIIPVESRPIHGFPPYRIGIDGSVWTCWKRNGKQSATLGATWKKMTPSLRRGSGHPYAENQTRHFAGNRDRGRSS